MSSPVASIEASELAFDALLEMTRRNVHHLAVQKGERLLGVVSSHDLIPLHTTHPVALARAIDTQESLDDLTTVAPRLHAVVRWLVGTGARAFDVGRLISELKDGLVRRTIALTDAALEADGEGARPCRTRGAPSAARGAASRRSRASGQRPPLRGPAH
jgi:CBS domain-containing protein